MRKTIFALVFMLIATVASVFAADLLSINPQAPNPVIVDPEFSGVLEDFRLNNIGSSDLNITVKPILMSDGVHGDFILTGVAPVPTNFIAGDFQLVDITGTIAANQFAGLYSGLLNVTGGTASASFTLNVLVNAQPSLTPGSVSLTALQGGSDSDTLYVSNTGNSDVTTNLIKSNLQKVGDASKFISASEITLGVSSLIINYGQTANTQVTVNVPSSQEPGTYEGNITLTYGAQQTQAAISVIVNAPTSSIATSVETVTTEERPGEDFSTTFTVENTGTTDLVGLALTVTLPSDFDNVTASPALFNLTAGQTQVINVQGEIPEDIDTTIAHTGNIQISNTQVTKNVGLELNGQIMVELNRVDVYVGNKRERVDEGDVVDQIEPGDSITIKGELENLWPDRKDIDFDIENIEVNIVVYDIDDGDDIDEDLEVDDISADEKETFQLEFDVPYNTDEDTFDVEITITAEDENNAEYEITFNFELEVEKENDRIKIVSAELDRNIVSCDRTVQLFAEVINIGSDTQRNVVFEVKSSALGILEQETTIKLDDDPDEDDNSFSKTFLLTVPDNTRAGTYRLSVNAYLDRTDLDDSELVDLIVQDCGETLPEEPEEPDEKEEPKDEDEEPKDEDKDVVIQPIVTPPTGGVVIQPPQKEDKFTESTTYIVLLVFLVIIVLVGVVMMATMLFRKPQH